VIFYKKKICQPQEDNVKNVQYSRHRVWVQSGDCRHCVRLQPVHQVQVDELLLYSHVLVVDDVGEQPSRLTTQVEIVGRQEGRHDGGEVGMANQIKTDSDGIGTSGKVGEKSNNGCENLDERSGVALLKYLVGGNVQARVEKAATGELVVELLVGGEGVEEPQEVDGGSGGDGEWSG